MSASNIKHMVERFLSWRLPADFAPDGGISFEPTYRSNATEIRREPLGTNLLEGNVVRHPAVVFGQALIDVDSQVPRRGNRFSRLIGPPLWAADQPTDRESGQRPRQPVGLFDALRRQVGIRTLPGLGAQRQRMPDQQEEH